MLLVLALPVLAADPHMTKEERANALQWLEQSRAEFLAAVDGVTAAQWKWKPAPDRWSVGEVAEHVVLAEAGQFGQREKMHNCQSEMMASTSPSPFGRLAPDAGYATLHVM